MSRTLLDAMRQIRPDTVAESLLTPELRAKINASTADLTALTAKVENLITLEKTDSATIEQLQVIIAALENKDGSHDSMIDALNELANAASSGLSAEVIARIAGDAALQAAIDTANEAATSLTQKVGVIEAQIAAQAQAIAAAQSTADTAVANAKAAQNTADIANALAAQADGKADQALAGNELTATAAAAAQVAADAAKAAADAAMAAALAIKVPELKQAKLPVDGVSQVFALPEDADETKFISVFDNGQLIWMNGDDYTLVGRDIHLQYIPAADRDKVYIHYYNKIAAVQVGPLPILTEPPTVSPGRYCAVIECAVVNTSMTLSDWNAAMGTTFTAGYIQRDWNGDAKRVLLFTETRQTLRSLALNGQVLTAFTSNLAVDKIEAGVFHGINVGDACGLNFYFAELAPGWTDGLPTTTSFTFHFTVQSDSEMSSLVAAGTHMIDFGFH